MFIPLASELHVYFHVMGGSNETPLPNDIPVRREIPFYDTIENIFVEIQ
jgi:hypothetical protein